MLDQVTAIEQTLDDAGAGGFGADAGGVLEFLFETRVLHILGDVFHRLDQVAFGERFGWLGPEVLEVDPAHRALGTFTQRRQGLWLWGFASLGRHQRFRQGTFPARLDDLFAYGP